jgi:hypothetical protein
MGATRAEGAAGRGSCRPRELPAKGADARIGRSGGPYLGSSLERLPVRH